jgi:hypothetical protein
MRSPLFILVAAFLVSLLIAQYVGSFHAFQGSPKTASGSDLLLTLLRRDQSLAPALAAADRGDSAPLLEWLNAADPLTRQTLVMVLEHIALSHDGLDGLDRNNDSAAMDAAFYRYRQRFIAFVNIPTGDRDLDAELDNLLAYILVAGTSQPSASDVGLAKQILPRLEKQVEQTPTSAVWDTIGCVYYVSGEDAKAKVAFQQAVNCAEREMAKIEAAKKPTLERTLSLARRRLQAAQEADLRAVEKRGSTIPRVALPLNETSSAPAAEPVH